MDKREGEVSRFSFDNFFCLTCAEKTRKGTLQSFSNSGYRQSLDEKEGPVSRFSVENFFSHSDEKFGRGTLRCCVLENFP